VRFGWQRTSRLGSRVCATTLLVAALAGGAGSAWGSVPGPVVKLVPGTSELLGVGCTPGRVCVATSILPDLNLEAFPLTVHGDKVKIGSGVFGGESGAVACPTASLCESVGGQGFVDPIAVGPSGLTPEPGVRFKHAHHFLLEGIACPTANTCVVVGLQRPASTSVAVVAELRVTGSQTVLGEPVTVPGAYDLAAIACPTATSCVASGQTSGVLAKGKKAAIVVIDVGSSHLSVGPVQQVKGAFALQGVACTTSQRCLAVGFDYPVTDGGFLAVTVGATLKGTTLSVGVPAMLSGFESSLLGAVACPTTTLCQATGFWSKGNGTIFGVVPVTDGHDGPALGTPEKVPGISFTSIADIVCPKAQICVAVGAQDSTGAVATFTPVP
jgi:hypothetical protein